MIEDIVFYRCIRRHGREVDLLRETKEDNLFNKDSMDWEWTIRSSLSLSMKKNMSPLL